MQVLKNYKFSIILLAGVLVGAIAGTIMGEKSAVLQPFADVFLNMVFVIIAASVCVHSRFYSEHDQFEKAGENIGHFLFGGGGYGHHYCCFGIDHRSDL
ncbi:hypothetical protein ACWHAM_20495 [Paenibacillus terrae]